MTRATNASAAAARLGDRDCADSGKRVAPRKAIAKPDGQDGEDIKKVVVARSPKPKVVKPKPKAVKAKPNFTMPEDYELTK